MLGLSTTLSGAAALLGSRAGKIGAVALLVALLGAAGGFAFWRGIARIDGMVDAAREEATKARDAYWTGEIERANAIAERARADQIEAAAAADRAANDEIRRLEDQLSRLENENARLPNGDGCGLSGGRVRLLPH